MARGMTDRTDADLAVQHEACPCRRRARRGETRPAPVTARPSMAVAADLIAVIVAVTDDQPRVLTLAGTALPAGPFASEHRSLQSGLRSWVERQTHHPLGYVEQLYTFADRDRSPSEQEQRVISVSYLGLTRELGTLPDVPGPGSAAAGDGASDGTAACNEASMQPGSARARVVPAGAGWCGWYDYFPWEDRRDGAGERVVAAVLPRLDAWAAQESGERRRERERRAAISFGAAGARSWNEELVLQRYELLHEAGLVEGAGDGAGPAGAAAPLPGRRMVHDHRRILATGIARLRAKIKYRPVVFELMPAEFTLLQLQRAVEALAGRLLHKPNFRRLIAQQALVEETGAMTTGTGGRPAKLFRFRREVLLERAAAGTKLPLARAL